MTSEHALVDSDSDDAPEEVSNITEDQINIPDKDELSRKLKAERKLKNKARDELFKAQKKAKLEKIQASRLSDDVLDSIQENKSTEAQPDEAQVESHHIHFEGSGDELESTGGDSGIDNTIGLTGRISAKSVRDMKHQKSLKAGEFKQRMLDRSLHKKQTAKERMLQLEKRKARRQQRLK